MTMTTILAAALSLAPTTEKVDPAAYPELDPVTLLPAIIADIKRTLPDPYSMRDFILCPARQIKLENAHPVNWVVDFGFNSRNESGGYSGLTKYTVAFKGGRITLHAFTSRLPGKDGFDRLINDAAIKSLLKCMPVPNARIQELLDQPLSAGH